MSPLISVYIESLLAEVFGGAQGMDGKQLVSGFLCYPMESVVAAELESCIL